MRVLALVFGLFPSLSAAETFEVYAPVTSVLLFTNAAQITREVEIDLPAGDHKIILAASLIEGVSIEQIHIDGATIGARQVIERRTPRPASMESAQVAQARAALKAAKQELHALQDRQSEMQLPKVDGEARLNFMSRFGDNESLGQLSGEDLAAVIGAIGTETRKANEMIAQAAIEMRGIKDALQDAKHAVAIAEQTLNGLVNPDLSQYDLAIEVSVPVALQSTIRQTQYIGDVFWTPVYEFHLASADSDTVDVHRSVQITQASGEGWTDVELRLTSATLLDHASPTTLNAWRRSITRPTPKLTARDEIGAMSEAMMEPQVVLEEAAAMFSSFDGFYATFSLPGRVSLPISYEPAELLLEPLQLDANIFAQAVPEFDETAVLIAEISNQSGVPLLGDEAQSMMYLNDQLVGFGSIDSVATGQVFELGFGPIDGLRLGSAVLDDNSGDRGILRGRHIKSQSTKYSLENFTDRTWDLKVLGRVPFSSQEDLEIEWDANFKPDVVNVNDKRGVLQWDLTLDPGQSEAIVLNHTLTWPEGWELR